MSFIGFNKLKGTVLFTSPELRILYIEDSAIQSDIPEQIYDNLSQLPLVKGGSLAMAPRYPEYIFVFYHGQRGFSISDEMLNSIDENALAKGFGHNLQRVAGILRSHKSINSQLGGPADLFNVAQVKDGELSFYQDALFWGANKVNYDIGEHRFEINLDVTDNDIDNNMIFFMNEFETISYKVENFNKSTVIKIINKIRDRMNMEGRICKHYMITRSLQNCRNQITCKTIPNMKVEDMLNFFGHIKKSQTKVETLAECLRGWTQKNVKSIPVGSVFFVEINLSGQRELPFDIVPVDFLLSHASHMRVLASEAIDNKKTRLITQITEKPTDDLAQMIYAMFENNNVREMSLLGFTQEIIKKSIKELKRSIKV